MLHSTIILSLMRWEVAMKGKDFWQFAFLLLGLINLVIEIGRNHSDLTDIKTPVECQAFVSKLYDKPKVLEPFPENRAHPRETIAPKHR
jgi:hypothetical protein